MKRLLPKTKIYVGENALQNAINGANSPNALARALLYVVFKKEALYECNSTAYGNSIGSKKMLNQKGMQAIYKFVKITSQEKMAWCPKGWTEEHEKKMKKSIQQKLTELKSEKKINECYFNKQKMRN